MSCLSAPWAAVLASAVLGLGAPVGPQEPPAPTWRVVTKESPPFAFQDGGGAWHGIAIDLAQDLAGELGVRLELLGASTVEAMLARVASGEVDAAMAAVSVTPEREARFDFSHPYFASGLGVAVRHGGERSWPASLLRGVTSRAFLKLLGLVLALLLGTGLCFWALERRRNPQFQETDVRESIGVGVWWSTIILFGHKGIFPRTLAGRALAATGMLLSILLLSVLTGAIASVLTLEGMETSVRGLEDLRRIRTVAVEGTSGQAFLEERLVPFRRVATPAEGLSQVEAGAADALVHDEPLLRYLVRDRFPDLRVLDRTFEPQDYAVAMRLESPWRKPVNRALLRLRGSEAWSETLLRYLGRD